MSPATGPGSRIRLPALLRVGRQELAEPVATNLAASLASSQEEAWYRLPSATGSSHRLAKVTVTEDFPLPLRNAIESGNCVLFLGAGIGAYAHDANGNPAPDGTTLAQELADHFSIEVGAEQPPDLAKIAQIVEIRKGRAELQAFLTERLAGLEPNDTLRWLFTLTWKAIFTTNYDRVIQRAYELIADPPQTPVTISASSELVTHDPRFEVPVYHLHGSLFGGSASHVLITQDDYARFREQRRMLFELLKYNFATTELRGSW